MEKTKIYIDNNVWDILCKFNVDLNAEFSNDEFELMITREAEFEITGMPDAIREYTQKTIQARRVKTDSYFGFYDSSLSDDEQRNGGFGDLLNPDVGGRYADSFELEYMQSESYIISSKKRPTGLFKNEADVSLGARSLIGIVLTCDGKKSLKRAREKWNGVVVDIKKYDGSMAFGAFIKKELSPSSSE